MSTWKRLDELVRRKIDGADRAADVWPKVWLIRSLQLIYLVIRDLLRGQLSLRAMSLVYTTMLSLVPLLAVTFSVLKAFGVHNQAEPLLDNLLAGLGPKGAEITDRVIGFVENMRVGVLGSIGLALLIYFVVSLVHKIESTLNYIWKIKRPRGLVRRFSEYLSVILIGPVLIFAAIGITAAVFQKLVALEPIGTAVSLASRLIPYVLVCAAFTFIYIFIPNTRVRFGSALVGGVVAGVLWQTIGWLFASFVASSAKYAAIYSGFAVLVVFMIWLYVSWYILLIGAQFAYYHQHPGQPSGNGEKDELTGSVRERLAFLIMFLVGYNHYHNRQPWTVESLASYLKLSPALVHDRIDDLIEGGFVVATGSEPPAYLPARDIETITLKALFEKLRNTGEESYRMGDGLYSVPGLNDVMKSIDQAIAVALGAQTVKSLVLDNQELTEYQPRPSPQSSSEKRRTA